MKFILIAIPITHKNTMLIISTESYNTIITVLTLKALSKKIITHISKTRILTKWYAYWIIPPYKTQTKQNNYDRRDTQ